MPEQLNGETRLFPIIGDPIRYAESPVRFTHTLHRRGLNALCVPMQVATEGLDTVMAGLRATANVDGLLITTPHKATAFDHCATTSDRSTLLGVVSVLRRNGDGSWHGDMLDGIAFVNAQIGNGARIDESRALLIGTGGAGRAIALALVEAGLAELILHDVDRSSSTALAELLKGRGETRVSVGESDPTGCDLVFNATPMGMDPNDPVALDVSLLSSSMFVGDVVAGHGTTPLIAAAQSLGCGTAGGADMVEAVQELMADFLLEA